jgi:molybdopterin synthase catalytic subunit/molybdopterin converting factor small subunit
MRVTVLYFAIARERAGTGKEVVELPAGSRLAQLRSIIVASRPALGALLPQLRWAVSREFVEDAELHEGDEVALIPPVAGGIDLGRVVDRPIRVEEVVDSVRGDGFGGVVTFTGAVRRESHGRQVVRLEYEAYAPMAEAKIQAIGTEIEARWMGCRVAILHRVGSLQVGDIAVVIAVAAPHRRAAFEACAYAIDRLKQEVPIWKKEVFQDGSVWVGSGP